MNLENEGQLRSEATRGQRAAELLADPLLVEAFALLDERFNQQWADSPARDTEGRERIWLMKKLLKNVGEHLAQVAMTGKMASLQLEQHKTMLQKAKDWAREAF
jgi:hypothetical protein